MMNWLRSSIAPAVRVSSLSSGRLVATRIGIAALKSANASAPRPLLASALAR